MESARKEREAITLSSPVGAYFYFSRFVGGSRRRQSRARLRCPTVSEAAETRRVEPTVVRFHRGQQRKGLEFPVTGEKSARSRCRDGLGSLERVRHNFESRSFSRATTHQQSPATHIGLRTSDTPTDETLGYGLDGSALAGGKSSPVVFLACALLRALRMPRASA